MMDGWTGHMMKRLQEKRPQHPLLYVIKKTQTPYKVMKAPPPLPI
jgi:hypothetical protein